MKLALAIWGAILPVVGWAVEPQLGQGAQLLKEDVEAQGVLVLPIGAYLQGEIPSVSLEGEVRRRSWRISSGFSTTTGLAEQLRRQLAEEGFEVIYFCSADACGGFDFRFGLDVFLPPNMFVDLSDYHFLSARRDTEDGELAAWVLVSRTVQAGMVQINSVGGEEPKVTAAEFFEASTTEQEPVVAEAPDLGVSAASDAETWGRVLQAEGHVVLDDLSFETGSSALSQTSFASVVALAGFLKQNPNQRVALVGHTDNEGSLASNVSLSQRRARSVLNLLVQEYDVAPKQIEAHGAGYLSPLSSNDTEDGRRRNRRVEAVLLTANK